MLFLSCGVGPMVSEDEVQCETILFFCKVIAVFNEFATRLVNGRFGTTFPSPLATIASLLCIKCGCISDNCDPAAGDQATTGACVRASSTLGWANLQIACCSSTVSTVAVGFTS